MEAKLFKIVKDRGLTIGISSDGNVMHVSLIPKSMMDKTVPVSFSCVEGTFFKSLEKALDEMLSMETEMMNAEGFKKGLKEKAAPKKDEGLFAGSEKKEQKAEPEDETQDDDEYPGNGDTDEEHGESCINDVDMNEEHIMIVPSSKPEEEVTAPTPEPKPKKEKPKEVVKPKLEPKEEEEDLF